jgi:hypothetical protein
MLRKGVHPHDNKPIRASRHDVVTCLSLDLTRIQAWREIRRPLTGGGAEGTMSREAEASEVEQQHRTRPRLTTIAGAFTNR